MGFALGDEKAAGRAGAFEFVDQAVGVVDAAAPEAFPGAQGFGFAQAGMAVALDVLDQEIDAFEGLFVFLLPLGVFLPGAGRKQDVHGASGGEEGMGPGFAAFDGADGLGEGALVGRGMEGIRPDDFKRQPLPDDRLAKEKADGRREVEAGGGKQVVGFAAEVGVKPDLEGGGAHL